MSESDLEARLAAVAKLASLMLAYLSDMAHDSKARLHALKALLAEKGLVSEGEWDHAVEQVERDESALFQLDPEIQEALAELRRILRSDVDPPQERLDG